MRPFIPVILTLALLFTAAGRADETRTRASNRIFPSAIALIGTVRDDDPGACTIHLMSATGENLRLLCRRDGGSYLPGARFSRSGHRLGVCYSAANGSTEIQVIDSTGRATKLIESGGGITAWSPDDTKLAWYRLEPRTRKPESYVVEVSTRKQTRLTLPPDYMAEDWHPQDERRIAIYLNPRNLLYRERKGDAYPARQLDLLKSDGSTTPLTRNPSTDNIWARFSRDGNHIVHYGRRLDGEKALEYAVVRKWDGSLPEVVCEFTRFGDSLGLPWFRPHGPPAWSPDGSTIAWLVTTNTEPRGEGQQWELLFIPCDGSQPRRLSLADMGFRWVSAVAWR